jgi:hypothetical protein
MTEGYKCIHTCLHSHIFKSLDIHLGVNQQYPFYCHVLDPEGEDYTAITITSSANHLS